MRNFKNFSTIKNKVNIKPLSKFLSTHSWMQGCKMAFFLTLIEEQVFGIDVITVNAILIIFNVSINSFQLSL